MAAESSQGFISIVCKGCGTKFVAPAAAAGRRGKCPDCGASLDVPAPAVPVTPVVEARPAPAEAAPPDVKPDMAAQKARSRKRLLAAGIAAWFVVVGLAGAFIYLVYIRKPAPQSPADFRPPVRASAAAPAKTETPTANAPAPKPAVIEKAPANSQPSK